jgi:hypothetical protein
MSYRSLTAIIACAGAIFVSSEVLARPVTTDECLARGLCAYVSPHGRVTCGKCPGQVRAIDVPDGATALCADDQWSTSKTRRNACVGHGGVKVLLNQ